tara:strand:+ start:331 stop:1569 length:1239 start_codon:yes stop_codon:yes gene_type:complete
MSRILRRPMFRGGKVVSSYGNGIASGLANGGRVGYKNAGIVTLQDLLSQTNKNMSGADILKYANKNNLNLGNNFKINEKSIFTENEPVGMGNFGASPSEVAEVIANPVFREEEEFEKEITASGDVVFKLDENEQRIPIEKNDYSSNLSVAEKIAIAKDAERDQQGSDLNLNEEVENISGTNILEERADSKKIKMNSEELPKYNPSDKGEKADEREESLEYTIEDYKKMLGGDKAFRRDLGDQLGLLAGAEGATAMEKFNNFLKLSSQSGPSRTEKIEQAAATIDIKDKIASKRAAEQTKLTLAGIDYKIGATMKAQQAAASLQGKDWIDSLRYVSENLFKGSGKGLDNTSVIEETLRLKYKKPVKKYIVSSETEIPKLNISEGFSIVVLPDGSKKIYEAVGDSAKERTDLQV